MTLNSTIMNSGVEANVKVSQVGAHSFKVKTPDTAYPFTNTYANGIADGEEIVPYMARVHSPIRVTYYSSPNMQVKRKSRVDEVAKNSVFSYRPLKRNDKVANWNRFRSPDATLPSLRYIPPWVSITKSDYIDPRLCNESEISITNTPQPLVRSYTDIGLITPRIDTPVTPAISVTSQPLKTPRLLASRSESRTTGKTSSMEKKVTIVDPAQNNAEQSADMEENVEVKSITTTPAPINISPVLAQKSPGPSPFVSPKNRVQNVKLPDTGINYYSGYLPPEFSDRIAEGLNIRTSTEMEDVSKQYQFLGKDGQHYKPLVGDRKWFMKDPYPTKPRLYQSDIEQIRFEGHKRLLQSNGQAPSNFSVLKKNGPSIKPPQNGAHLEEAMRTQQRLSKSAVTGSKRVPNVSTSIEMFEKQREKTYHLQNLAKEMLQQ